MLIDDEPLPQSAAVLDQEAPCKPVRWLPVGLISLALIVLNTGWIANSEMKTFVTEITIASLFSGVLFILFVVTLLNLAAGRISRGRHTLNQAGLMMIYSLLSMSSVVAGVGNMGFFLPSLTSVYWYADKSNRWQNFWYLIPSYIGPRSRTVLRGFYEGRASFLHPAIMHAWALPLAVCGLFFLTLIWTTFCLSAIVRRRWMEDEHLTFPIIALPLAITRDAAPIYRSKLLWTGFTIPCFLHSLNSLHSLFRRFARCRSTAPRSNSEARFQFHGMD